MNRKASLMIVVLILAAALLCGCGGDKLKPARDALQKSGVLKPFFNSPVEDLAYPNMPFADRVAQCVVEIDRDALMVTDENGYQSLAEGRITEPVYTVCYNDEILGKASAGFTSAKAEGGRFTDEDALTKGTLIFMVSDSANQQVYRNKKDQTVVGQQERLTVYLYDIASGKLFGTESFVGEDLENRYEKFPATDTFVNSVRMDEVNAWIDSYR